ncbi:unnamed protein product [Mytilus edulis]|uniref:Uncharacterized protein n=1 Tax=Mytilus edulis TaxID=6550 RepID=A0A8S3RE16_MYTED|nr:unnamed protein product [Mytilus edulis]
MSEVSAMAHPLEDGQRKRQTNLVLNGTPSDSKKYKETVDKDCYGATLYIYSFNEKDIDAYTCAHDFDEYTDTIKLHEIKYRSYPDVREIKTELQCNNQKLLWTFDLLDIYPIATCTFHTELLDQNNSEQVVNKKVDPVYGSDELLKMQIDSQKGDYGTTE